MKKLLILLLSALSLTVFAQQKKVAVYVTGDDPINSIMGDHLVDGIAHDGKYIAVERTASFLNELVKEQSYQQTGAVDDSELSRLGKQFGVDYVCVATPFDVWGEKYVSARMIDVERAEIIATSSANGKVENSTQFLVILNTLTSGLLKSFEQSKMADAKKVAVYVTRTGNKDVDIILGDQLVTGFATSGRYLAIERTQGFLNQLNKEATYQQSGVVDDSDLMRLGKQFGVQYVCVAKTSQLFGDYFIAARLIDVEHGEVINSYKKDAVQLGSSQQVVSVAQEIAEKLSDKTIQEIAYEEEQERLRIEEEKRLAEEVKRQAEEEAKKRKEERKRLEEEKRRQREFTSSKTGSHAGHEYVDLGLPSGLKWSKYRLYSTEKRKYNWGEIKYNTYIYKYIKNGGYKDIGTNISGTKYDAARACWGGNWRMPTYKEVQELMKFCKVERIDGSKALVGPNGAYIFIDMSSYWTASIDGNGTSENAWRFTIIGEIKLESWGRYNSCYILPVCE